MRHGFTVSGRTKLIVFIFVQVQLKHYNTMEIFMKTLLSNANIPQARIKQLTSPANMTIFASAFTTAEINPDANYEWYEQLGDVVHASFIIDYIYERFPNLRSQGGVTIVARLRIAHCCRKAMAAIARRLGIEPLILASEAAKARNMDSLLEDVFEALIGALKIVGDSIEKYMGNILVTRVLRQIYDSEPFDMRYETLVDAKTRLKEFHDAHTNLKLVTSSSRPPGAAAPFTAQVHLDTECIGVGQAWRLTDAQQQAAGAALTFLAGAGHTLRVPDEYKQFSVIPIVRQPASLSPTRRPTKHVTFEVGTKRGPPARSSRGSTTSRTSRDSTASRTSRDSTASRTSRR